MTFDYPFLETAGRGHFVGVSMPIDHPLAGWWGEGDEKVWVDDDDFPPYIGTGSEDYFGDAWGIRYLSGPSFGASSMKGHRTCNYRWHFMDFIPFTKRMRMTIENYGPNGAGPARPIRLQLDGVLVSGRADAAVRRAARRQVHRRRRSRRQADRDGIQPERPSPDSTPTTCGPTAWASPSPSRPRRSWPTRSRPGKAKIVTDALRPYEFDRERAVDFGTVAAGQKLADAQAQRRRRRRLLPAHLHRSGSRHRGALASRATAKPCRSWPGPSRTCCSSGDCS